MPKIKTDQLFILGAVGVGFWFWNKQREKTNGVNGSPINGNGNDPIYGGIPGSPYYGGEGPANVGGSINTVQMADHSLIKSEGDIVTLFVSYFQTTTDFAGNPIDWPTRVTAELGHSTGWGVGGWDNMGNLLGSRQSDYGYGQETSNEAYPGEHAPSFQLVMGFEPDPPQDWDIRARLEMQESDAEGNPNGVWTEVSRMSHEGAVVSDVYWGSSNYGGDITGLTFWNRGNGMKRLSMGQERPPWGIAGNLTEVRQWPRSDRNPTLPGVEITVRNDAQAKWMMGGSGNPTGPGYRYYAV